MKRVAPFETGGKRPCPLIDEKEIFESFLPLEILQNIISFSNASAKRSMSEVSTFWNRAVSIHERVEWDVVGFTALVGDIAAHFPEAREELDALLEALSHHDKYQFCTPVLPFGLEGIKTTNREIREKIDWYNKEIAHFLENREAQDLIDEKEIFAPTLPMDVLQNIISFSKVSAKRSMSEVCKFWNRAVSVHERVEWDVAGFTEFVEDIAAHFPESGGELEALLEALSHHHKYQFCTLALPFGIQGIITTNRQIWKEIGGYSTQLAYFLEKAEAQDLNALFDALKEKEKSIFYYQFIRAAPKYEELRSALLEALQLDEIITLLEEGAIPDKEVLTHLVHHSDFIEILMTLLKEHPRFFEIQPYLLDCLMNEAIEKNVSNKVVTFLIDIGAKATENHLLSCLCDSSKYGKVDLLLAAGVVPTTELLAYALTLPKLSDKTIFLMLKLGVRPSYPHICLADKFHRSEAVFLALLKAMGKEDVLSIMPQMEKDKNRIA